MYKIFRMNYSLCWYNYYIKTILNNDQNEKKKIQRKKVYYILYIINKFIYINI